MIAPLIFGAQRFSMTSGLAAGGTSQIHVSVGQSMAWANGDLNLLRSTTPASASEGRMRRRLSLLPPETPAELIALLNTLVTFSAALAIVCVLQLAIVLYWRHRANRKYYLHVRVAVAPLDGGEAKPPSFLPFPKAFVWPSTPIFITAAFSSGITRTSVTLLAARPAECGPGCLTVGLTSLVFVIVLISALIADLVSFRARHRESVVFKRAPRAPLLGDITDHWMWLRGQIRTIIWGARLMSSPAD